jgi:hypothetical protein
MSGAVKPSAKSDISRKNSGSSIAKIFLMITAAVSLGIILACGGCLGWVIAHGQASVASGLPDPDAAFSTGTEHGLDVYIWECFKGTRVAVYRSAGFIPVSIWQRQEAPCGQLTAIEKEIPDSGRRSTNPEYFWGLAP